MLLSMTGYGKASGIAGNFEVEAEIKSFNNRYLDINVRLPKELYSLEFELREIIKQKVSRGKVTLTLNLKPKDISASAEILNKFAIEQAGILLNTIVESVGIEQKPQLEHFLYLKELFLDNTVEIDDETFEDIAKVTSEALTKMIEMRKAEGEQLEKDFKERLNFIEDKINKIENSLKTDVEEYFSKLKERAKNLLSEFSQYDERLKVELALLAEKYDTSEEIVRLRSHIKQFEKFMNLPKDAGKKLNFILQEMNREANTIGSKAVSTNISYNALAIKEELEKMREQVQNIE